MTQPHRYAIAIDQVIEATKTTAMEEEINRMLKHVEEEWKSEKCWKQETNGVNTAHSITSFTMSGGPKGVASVPPSPEEAASGGWRGVPKPTFKKTVKVCTEVVWTHEGGDKEVTSAKWLRRSSDSPSRHYEIRPSTKRHCSY